MSAPGQRVIAYAMCLLALQGVARADSAPDGRWYSADQVARGGEVYAQHCASCHGVNAKGGLANGREVPPLDGSGHSSHHGLEQMVAQVTQGTVATGGTMPPFATVLSEADTRAAIAWVQSLWSDAVYRTWRRNYGGHSH